MEYFVDFTIWESVPLPKGEKLPHVMGYCRECKKNSSKVIDIVTSCRAKRPMYLLKCIYCGETYTMYPDRFKRTYVGFTTKNGCEFRPTYGNPDVATQDYRAFERNQAENPSDSLIASFMIIHHCDETKARNLIKASYKRRDEESRSFKKEMQEERREREERRANATLSSSSNSRKEMIEKGILKYDKRLKCLVNTETGEIVKI